MRNLVFGKVSVCKVLFGLAVVASPFITTLIPTVSAQTIAQPAPHITGVSPLSGPAGTKVTIYGTGFSDGNIVNFGPGIVIPESGSSATQLTFFAPTVLPPKCNFEIPQCTQQAYMPLPGTYSISVASDLTFGAISNEVSFTLTPSVVITSISPAFGPVGTQVTIYGRGFSSIGNAISFGSTGIVAQVGNSTSVIKFVIPSQVIPQCAVTIPPCSQASVNLSPGSFAISVSPDFNLNQKSNSLQFTLTRGSVSASGPVITSISPMSGTVGTQVTIKGLNFSPNLNVIDFGSGVVLPRPSGNDLVFNVPDKLFPRCTIFGNPPCQVSLPPSTVPGDYNLDVAISATTISNQMNFTVNPIPLPTSTPALPPPATSGNSAVQATVNINVRSAPSLSAAIIGVEKAGSVGSIISGPVNADGFDWVEVFWQDGLDGWSVQKYLVTKGTSPCPISIGDKVIVSAGGNALVLYVRSNPSVNASIIGAELDGAQGIVMSGPVVADSYNWWQIKFEDGISGWAVENDFADISCIVIPPAPPPSTAPFVTLSFITPQAGATVSGVVPITVSVSSNVPVTEVDFYRDGVLASVAKAPPYSWNWDATQVFNGFHTLTAKALTSAGISDSKTISVNVTGGIPLPAITVTFVTPQSGATVSGVVPVTVSVSSNVSVTGVDFYRDGKPLGTVSSAPYTVNWDTTKEYNGSHVLLAVAKSPGLIGSKSIFVNVTGGIPPPAITVSFITPQAGATVSGVIPVTVSVSSNVSITEVDFYRDGVLLGAVSSTPYTVNWDTTQVLNGPHTLFALARGQGGATGAKAITVNVTGGLSLPVVSFITPQAGAMVSGVVPVTVSVVASNPAVTEVDFYRDGALASVSKTPPYSWNWDATQVFNGFHVLTATALTTIAGISGSKTISVNVTGGIAAPAIAISFITPQAGATVWGTVPIAVSVSSTVPISEVDFYKDNTSLGVVKTTPYSLNWDTTQELSGTRSLIAIARATSTSASKSITVNVIPVPLFAVGDRVKAQTGSNLGLNVRAGPSTNFSIIATEPNGSLGTVISIPPVPADSFNWWQIKWDNGATGWSAEAYLVKAL